MSLPTAEELAEIVGGTPRGSHVRGSLRGVSVDSRRCYSGEVFFALKGRHTNGNAHVEDAFASGAAVAVMDRPTHTQMLGAVIRVDSRCKPFRGLPPGTVNITCVR